jgi:hypothetical protein
MGFSFEKNGIKTVFGQITVDSVEKNQYKKGQYQAQIRQQVTKIYPAGGLGNSNSDLLFEEDAENMEGGSEYTSTRVTWLPFTEKRSVKEVQAQLKKFKNANIYRIISDDVEHVLTDEQITAAELDKYDIDMDDYKESYLIRDSDGNELDEELYQQFFFNKKGKADVDMRPNASKSSDIFAEEEEDVEDAINA